MGLPNAILRLPPSPEVAEGVACRVAAEISLFPLANSAISADRSRERARRHFGRTNPSGKLQELQR